jgi:hypothetical protein
MRHPREQSYSDIRRRLALVERLWRDALDRFDEAEAEAMAEVGACLLLELEWREDIADRFGEAGLVVGVG